MSTQFSKDKTYCRDHSCDKKESCKRYTKTKGCYRIYFTESPIRNNECVFYEVKESNEAH